MLVCFFLLAFRVGYLQLLEHQQLANQADQRSIRTQVVPTNRAMITDRNNEALAVSVSSKDIVLDPKHILDTQTDTGNERWQSMANVLKIPLADVQHLIQSNGHKRFVYLARKVEDDNAAYISKLHLTGVSTEQDFSRFYPMGQDAAGLIGIVGQDNQGLEGIELGFNPLLQGKNGLRVYQKDGSGAVIGVIKSVDPVPPPNVTLSIDKFIQYVLYAQIRDGVVANQADSGCAVLVKIDTGEILGMASYPSFNPNNYGSTPAKDIRNVCSSDSFEPGSTVKPVVVMVGLEHKLIRPDTVLDTTPYRVNGHLIKDVGHWSKLTITGVLQKSSDIAVSHIALALPATALLLSATALAFHFGFESIAGREPRNSVEALFGYLARGAEAGWPGWLLLGLAAALVAWRAVLSLTRPESDARWHQPAEMAGFAWAWAGACLLVVPLAVYLLTYVPYLQLGHAIATPDTGPGYGWSLDELHAQMFGYHFGLQAGHASSSPWWSWPLGLKPVWFFNGTYDASSTAVIYNNGNPLLFWAGVPAIAAAGLLAWKRRSPALALLVMAFALQYLPWTRIERATFSYHYLTALPFAMLGVAYVMDEALRRPTVRDLAVGFLIMVNLLLLAAGNFMEPSSILLITAPLLFPMAMQLGIDPIHLGVLMTVNMEIGMRKGDMLRMMAVEAWSEYFIGISKDQSEVFRAKSVFAELDPQNASAFWGDTERMLPSILDKSIDNFFLVLPAHSVPERDQEGTR